MTQFEVRYLADEESGPVEPLIVEAAMFTTNGEFTDFFSGSARNIGGTLNPSGHVVFRVRNEIVAHIRKID